MTSFARTVLLAVVVIISGGCAGERAHREGLHHIAAGRFDEGLQQLTQASREAPDNIQFRVDLLRRQEQHINRLLASADAERASGALDSSEGYYRRVLQVASSNSRALAGIEALEQDRRQAPIIDLTKQALQQGAYEQASALLAPLLTTTSSNTELAILKRRLDEWRQQQRVAEPALQTAGQKPISLDFRDANVSIVFEALARSSGVNFILDQDLKPDLRTTIFLRHSTLENAIDLLLQTNRLQKKILDSNTILIYPNTLEKLKSYQELIFKGFYLANADVKQTQAMIKGLLKTKDLFIDEKLNLLVMRDTPEAIKLAEKLIAMHDLSEPEVMLEVEVLEVKRSRLTELGIQWPGKLTLAPLSSAGAASTTLSELQHLNASRIGATLSGGAVNLRRHIGDANILANPRIRARNREKAKIMIGDKVPVSTTTTTATGIVSESIQYLDVGIKLEVEPNIHLHNEVAIKIGLEVSSISNQVQTPGGSVAYQIGSRSASTVLRLKDGETQILAGLIGDEDRMSANRVPGLGDIPVLGRLFSSQKDDHQKTEIVLSITPHLIRNIKRPDSVASEFWSGTEMTLRNGRPTWQNNKDDDNKVVNSSATLNTHNAAPSMIAMQWQGPTQARVGEQFKLALKMHTDGGLRSLPFQLGFDPAVLQIVSITEGAFFNQDDVKTSMSSNIDAKNGKAFVSVVRSGIAGAQGEDVVAVFTFRVVKAREKTEVQLVAATPIANGDTLPAPSMPTPHVMQIVD